MSKEITELGKKWFAYVSLDHHKDRDCHFYIEVDYAYGEEPQYTAQHFGYIGKEFSATFSNYKRAEKYLLGAIKNMINQERTWVNDVLADPESYDNEQLEKAKLYAKLFHLQTPTDIKPKADKASRNE